MDKFSENIFIYSVSRTVPKKTEGGLLCSQNSLFLQKIKTGLKMKLLRLEKFLEKSQNGPQKTKSPL